MFPLIHKLREMKDAEPTKYNRVCNLLKKHPNHHHLVHNQTQQEPHSLAQTRLRASAFYEKLHNLNDGKRLFWHHLQTVWKNHEINREYPLGGDLFENRRDHYQWIRLLITSQRPEILFQQILEYNQPKKVLGLLFHSRDQRLLLYSLRKKFGLTFNDYLELKSDQDLENCKIYKMNRQALADLKHSIEDIESPSSAELDLVDDSSSSVLDEESQVRRDESAQPIKVEEMTSGRQSLAKLLSEKSESEIHSENAQDGGTVGQTESEDAVVFSAKERLRKLRIIFEESDMDDEPGLDIDEFKIAMRRISGDSMSEREIELIFMKVDANCDGNVDWDEFLEYTLREYQERDIMNQLSRDVYFDTKPRIRATAEHDIKCMVFCSHITASSTDLIDWSAGQYYSVTLDGLVKCWSIDFIQSGVDYPLIAAYKSAACFERVCDMICLPETRDLVVAFSTGFLKFYHTNGHVLTVFCVVFGLPNPPLCLDYVFREDASLLLFADQAGLIQCIRFESLFYDGFWSALGVSQPPNGVVAWALLKRSDKCFTIAATPAADEWILRMKFTSEINCIIACSSDPVYSLSMIPIQTSRPTLTISNRHGGFNCFDYNHKLHLIATCGRDRVLCIWAPDSLDKPQMKFPQHRMSIEKVMLTASNHFSAAITVDAMRTVRVFDIKEHALHQEFEHPDLGVKRSFVSFLILNQSTEEVVFGCREILTIRRHFVVKHKDSGTHSQTHKQPVVAALYNDLFDCVVSGCKESTIMVWNFQTGEKIIQFTNAHFHEHAGGKIPVAIKNMVFDANKRRLVTVGEDGLIKMWNFNNGACLSSFAQLATHDVNIVRYHRNRDLVIAAGFDKYIFMTRDTRGEDDIEPTEYHWPVIHRSDIVAVEVIYPNPVENDTPDLASSSSQQSGSVTKVISDNGDDTTSESTSNELDPCLVDDKSLLISASFDGEIILWDLFSGIPKCYLHTDGSLIALNTSARNKTASQKTLDHPSVFRQDSGELEEVLHLQEQASPYHGVKNNLSLGERENIRDEVQDNIISIPPLTNPSKEAVTSLLHLSQREQNDASVATILAASIDGFVRAWSTVVPHGGLKALFFGGHTADHFVTQMYTDDKNELLFTSDSAGYVKIWFICDWANVTLNAHQHEFDPRPYPMIRHPRYFAPYVSIRENALYRLTIVKIDHRHKPFFKWPTMLNSFRAHSKTISSLEVVTRRQIIVTASEDCSVRLFTFAGLYVGSLGQKDALYIDTSQDIFHPQSREEQGAQNATSSYSIKDVASDENLLTKPRAVVPPDITHGSRMTLDVVKNRKVDAIPARDTPSSTGIDLPDEDLNLFKFEFNVRSHQDPVPDDKKFLYFGFKSPITHVYGDISVYSNIKEKPMTVYQGVEKLLPPCIYEYSIEKIQSEWMKRLPNWLKMKYVKLQSEGLLYGDTLREMMAAIKKEEKKLRDSILSDGYENKRYQEKMKALTKKEMGQRIDKEHVEMALRNLGEPFHPLLARYLMQPANEGLLRFLIEEDDRRKQTLDESFDNPHKHDTSHPGKAHKCGDSSSAVQSSHLSTNIPVTARNTRLIAVVRKLNAVLTKKYDSLKSPHLSEQSDAGDLFKTEKISKNEVDAKDYAKISLFTETGIPRKLPEVPRMKRKRFDVEQPQQILHRSEHDIPEQKAEEQLVTEASVLVEEPSTEDCLVDLETVKRHKRETKKNKLFVEITDEFANPFAMDEVIYESRRTPKIPLCSAYGTFRSHFLSSKKDPMK